MGPAAFFVDSPMESNVFSHAISDRQLACVDAAARQTLIAAHWNALNADLGRYLAENLPADGYQLVKVIRVTNVDPFERCTRLILRLEVGQVTQHSQVQVFSDEWGSIAPVQPPQPAIPDYWQMTANMDWSKKKTPPLATPLPQRRHILVDKSPVSTTT